MYRFLTALALAAVLAGAADLSAQQGEPLQKSDLIRLLTGTTYTKPEVAGIVRQSCLSFRPTERDRADFRSLGADADVMAAIDGCARQPAAPSLELSMARTVFEARVGDTVRVAVRVDRSGTPESGLRLRLVGSARIRGGGGQDAVAFTDAGGRAVLRVPAGTAAATYNLTLDADVSLGGRRAVSIRVRPGPAASASGTPDPVAFESESATAPLRVEVRDGFGNGVPDVSVVVRVDGEGGADVLTGRTSADGVLEGLIDASRLGGANRLAVLSGGAVLGYVGVARPAARVARVVAVSGSEQRADAGRRLPEPLVVRVTDAEGAPSAEAEVRFEAANGSVQPVVARTDARGQASTTVTLGGGGVETTVTATAGEISRSFVFPITVGGMTAAAMQASMREAEALLDAGDYGAARVAYGRVAEADPSNLAAAVGVAETYAREGRHGEAVESYRAVLRADPARRDAQVGMARASLGAGDAAEAARWFELALSRDRTDATSWVGLGDARARLDRIDEARTAYENALSLDPANEAARRGLGRLAGSLLLVEGDLWGGHTDDNGRDPGFRWAELRIYPADGLELWGGFDNALNFRHPYLVRGQDDIKASYGGAAYAYGTDRAYRTSFEYGRREEPVDGTIQSTWTLEQQFAFPSGARFRLGGWLGHWFDQDDWVVFAEAGIPAGANVEVRPLASYGEYAGSGLGGLPEGVSNRSPAKEVRVGLLARYIAGSGFGVQPGIAYGNVDSDASEELNGGLWDATLRLWYTVNRTFTVDSFLQYQTLQGLPSFWRFGLGIRFGVDRPAG